MELLASQNSKDSPEVENWDDGDFDNFDDIHFRSASTATSVVSHPQANYRDSTSSRLSMRSDSNQGDEHWDVLVDEQSAMKDALTIAKSKGIPLPSNLPRSALEGGTIRRLGGKAVKKAIADDWSEDLDFADGSPQLKLAKTEDRDLSESLRQISAAFRSSPKSPDEKLFQETLKSPKARPALPASVSLENFRDVDDDDDFGDVPTIRVAKHRSPQKLHLGSSPQTNVLSSNENIEDDLELPTDGKLHLSTRKLSPRTPLSTDDFDMEWAEGSLGTRNAGARRGGGMSIGSSSISAMSPSVSSTFTGENDEDGLDGLVLPQGPVNFKDILKKRQESEKENHVPKSASSPQLSRKPIAQEEDWGEDLLIPNGKVFDSGRLTLHRNVKQKNQRATSPSKTKAISLNFTTTKPNNTVPRPRFGLGHERQERPRSHLEPVSETGAPIQRYQRPNSRLGHAAHSSISSIPAPATPTPSTPSRRDLRNTGSRVDMRYQTATTTNSQLLRAKRSMPGISSIASPTRLTFNRPPSRQDGSSNRMRPRSPPERPDSRLGTDKKGSAPFLPAGVSTAQSQHVSIKSATTRGSRRADSDGSSENMTAAQRSLSRLAGIRPQTPGKGRSDLSVAELAAQAKKTMNKPLRRRNWGDGSELEIFDDLPTSAAAEAQYTKQPIGRGAPRSIRSKIGQHGQAAASSTSLVSARSGTETPVPSTPVSPPKASESTSHYNPTSRMPRFAQDTAASRNARGQRSISTTFHNMRGEPLQPVSTNVKTVSSKPTYGSLRRKRSVQQKPHLIKPLGGDHNRPKEEKGMYYNPVLSRWEGNDTALAPFDVPDFLPHHPSPDSHVKTGGAPLGMSSPTANTPKPNMALIMNVGGSSGVQLVNGMVFDPRQMKWLKVARGERGDSISRGTGSVQLEEEEDVFAGLEDLKEESENMSSIHDGPRDRSVSGTHDKTDPFTGEAAADVAADEDDANHNSGHSGDEWGGVAEEFDVGPEFVRRQRSEEDRWKRKVEKWLRSEAEVAEEEVEGPGGWRWAIRDLVSAGVSDGFDAPGM